ncbi:MAG: 30S ribosomal protein S9 [Candidatus Pacebacteria bacterium]|jgi:small subunit ribosomal protein S9|nr:30S ribosomal protein S9 [bacterium]MDP6527759.1 30S ribosomal protein S9 [Candidatus Paceibacterota bacterium]MDP6659596.1 30S ribosomal protein S9 [Candidatus Paceibacterota bacterium]|tara:strand:- start:30220 stop:30615 length:396 start_codon:yes stop_codon:yes gene_type:complete
MATANKYIEAVGRRKTAVARVRLTKNSKNDIVINEKSLKEYFPVPKNQRAVEEAFGPSKDTFSVSAKVIGGGTTAQSEAIRHGIARALVKNNEELRKELKQAGYLKRDPRMKERKKFGLKGARRAPQWSKR